MDEHTAESDAPLGSAENPIAVPVDDFVQRAIAKSRRDIPPAVSSCMDCGHVGPTDEGDCARCGGPACPISPVKSES